MDIKDMAISEILNADNNGEVKPAEILEAINAKLAEYFPQGMLMNCEADGDAVRAEIGHELSLTYMAKVRVGFDYGDNSFRADITIDRSKDGLGMQSQSWETVSESEYEAGPSERLDDLMEMSQTEMFFAYKDMLTDLGVENQTAIQIAQKKWIIRQGSI
jgi:hypothetical protein